MTIKFLQEKGNGNERKREAGNREEAGLPQGTEKEELRVTGFPIGSGMTAEVVSGMTPYKKAGMTPASPSFPRSDTGIHKKGSPKADSESGRSPSPSFPYSSLSSFPRRRESGKGDESGRSMVETLGVLAIMGLLAVGGIIGYRYAVDKYRSNELWNNVKWISVQVMTDGSLQGMSSGDEMTIKSFSGDSDLILKRETAIGYSVRTGNLRESTCRQIRRDKPDWVEEVVSNEGAGCQDREDNDIKIYFNGQLNSETTDEDRYKRCERDEDCGDCGKCSEEKICVDYDALCQAPTPYCINGSCEPCPAGETLNSSGKCIDCFSSDRILWGLNIDTCHVCSNRFWIGSCFLCEAGTANGTPRTELSRCPHRYMPGTAEQGTSYRCIGTVNADQTECDWDCPAGQIGVGSQCWTCTEEMSGPATLNECRKCDNRMFVGMDEKNGSCASCSSPLAISYVRRVDCLKCPNRYMPGTGTTAGSGVCYLCDGTVSADGTACLPKSE